MENTSELTEVKALMVAHVVSNWNLILSELARWKEVIRSEVGVIYSTE